MPSFFYFHWRQRWLSVEALKWVPMYLLFSKGSVETNDNCTVKIKAAAVGGSISSSRFRTSDVVRKSGLWKGKVMRSSTANR